MPQDKKNSIEVEYFTFLTRSIQVLYCLFCRVRVCVLGKARARTKATAKANQSTPRPWVV